MENEIVETVTNAELLVVLEDIHNSIVQVYSLHFLLAVVGFAILLIILFYNILKKFM